MRNFLLLNELWIHAKNRFILAVPKYLIIKKIILFYSDNLLILIILYVL